MYAGTTIESKTCTAKPVQMPSLQRGHELGGPSLRLAQSVEHETLNLRVVGSSPTLGANCKIPRLETRGIWGRKGKKDPQQGSPRDTHTDNEGRDDKKRLLDFGRERSTTRIGGQQLHLHESPQEEWITKRRREGTGKTNKTQKDGRAKVQRNSRAREAKDKRAGTGWSCAYDRGSCHVTGRGNQSAPVS